jgi:hypothetical protein
MCESEWHICAAAIDQSKPKADGCTPTRSTLLWSTAVYFSTPPIGGAAINKRSTKVYSALWFNSNLVSRTAAAAVTTSSKRRVYIYRH